MANSKFAVLDTTNEGRINLVAIGKTGEGKSSTLNSINLCAVESTAPFHQSAGPESVTKSSMSTVVNIFGLSVRIVDTMGLFDTGLGETKAKKKRVFRFFASPRDLDEGHKAVLDELSKVIQMCADGIHAFLFVINGSRRFTEEAFATLDIILRHFGDKMLDHCIFLITGMDLWKTQAEIDNVESQIFDFVCQYFEARQCTPPRRFQFISFDNETTPRPMEQVEKLFEAVQTLLVESRGKAYTNHAFEFAQEELQRAKVAFQQEQEAQLALKVDAEVDKVTRELKLEKEKQEQEYRENEKRFNDEMEAARLLSIAEAEKQQKQKNALDKKLAEADKDKKDLQEKLDRETERIKRLESTPQAVASVAPAPALNMEELAKLIAAETDKRIAAMKPVPVPAAVPAKSPEVTELEELRKHRDENNAKVRHLEEQLGKNANPGIVDRFVGFMGKVWDKVKGLFTG